MSGKRSTDTEVDSFVFYRSFFEAIKDLSDTQQLEVYNAIFCLAFEKKKVDLTGISSTIMKLIRPNIEASIANRINGKKGGRPRIKSGVIENKKGGLFENKKGGFEKVITNGDVNVNEDVNSNVNEDSKFDTSGETLSGKITSEWIKALGVFNLSEEEKMSIKVLSDRGCLPEDAKAAKAKENSKDKSYWGKLSNENTKRLILTAMELRTSAGQQKLADGTIIPPEYAYMFEDEK